MNVMVLVPRMRTSFCLFRLIVHENGNGFLSAIRDR
jgi:hypothetical protein